MRAAVPFLVALTACGGPRPAPEAAMPDPAITYPDARRADHVDQYFDVEVADPYVWLEDLDSDETSAWIQAENALTRSQLDPLPQRDAFAARLSELWEYDRYGAPDHAGDVTFHTKHAAGADQPILLVRDGEDEPARVLLDPNTWSEDGTVSLAGWVPSDDGTRVAYAIADAGSDWRTWRVVDTASGEVLPDTISWVKFSGASWLPDGSGFFYSRYPEPASSDFEEKLADMSVWFHRVGTDQAADILVYEEPEHPQRGFYAGVTHDGARLFIHVSQGTEEKSRQYYLPIDGLDLTTPGGKAGGTVVKLLDDFDADYVLMGVLDDVAWFRTDLDAPKRRVIAIDLNQPEREHWTEIVPEGDDTLQSAQLLGGKLVTTWLTDAHGRATVYELDGTKAYDVALPGVGSISGMTGDRDEEDAYFAYYSFTHPTEIFRLHVPTGEVTSHFAPDVPFEPDDFTTIQVRYPSADGTMIPMFLTFKKDIDRSKTHPTLLYGYGGFNISITPRFSVPWTVWMEQGGVYASANLRGGGEYGRDWHLAGTKTSKQNVFDDFIAAGEWLVREGWTTPEQLGIHGRSNGGLLAGATLVQRPDLFGAAIPTVGVLDMLKYHRWTIGWAWASDYGTSEESREMFEYLLGYSPVHNAKPDVAYPPTLITTADHDDRVVPAHSYKFAAALQHAQAGPDPVLIRIETRAGHGAGTPVSMLVEENADKLAFLAHHLGLDVD